MDDPGEGAAPQDESMDSEYKDDSPSPPFEPLRSDETVSENATMIPPAINPPTNQPPRLKFYPDGSSGPWVVFFRPLSKPLNVINISRDLSRRFSSVTDICKVRPNKLRVVVANLKHANEIVACELFTREYRVYIPSRDVEIDGVVTEGSLTRDEILTEGVGGFKNPSLQSVKILDCKQLHKVSIANGKKIYTPSDSYRVTFSGPALPNYVTIGRLRLPVRLYVPRVMNCLNCKQLGHTATHCCNKARCSKCGENHKDDLCTMEPKCLHCEEGPHELSTCPTYKMRLEKAKRSLKQRSKRSFADMLKKADTTPIITENLYARLPTDESDSDASKVEFELIQPGESRKRKKTSRKLPRRKVSNPTTGMNLNNGSAGKKPKQVAPGANALNNKKEFPALPGTSRTPDAPNLTPRTEKKKSNDPHASTSTYSEVNSQLPQNESGCGLFTFPEAIEIIYDMFEIPDSLQRFLNSRLPKVKNFLRKLAERKPFIATLIDFDG